MRAVKYGSFGEKPTDARRYTRVSDGVATTLSSVTPTPWAVTVLPTFAVSPDDTGTRK